MLIADIIPDPNNERDHSKGIPELMASIEDAGFVGTIALRSHEDPTVVAGHGRLEALRRLGWTELPEDHIEYLDHLTDEEVARFRLNDNKTSDLSRWNRAKLKASVRKLESSGVDMSKFGFDFKSKQRSYGAERYRTDQAYNLHLVSRLDCGPSGFPELAASDAQPAFLQGFNYAKSTPDKDKKSLGCHFFIDDYQFERLWTSPENYLDVLRGYDCILTPDFSLYMDMPAPMQSWNRYRSQALGHWWQQQGLSVVPTLSWAQSEGFGDAFAGVPHHSTVAVSTVGVIDGKEAMEVWTCGMSHALDLLEPSRILLYGSMPDFDFAGTEIVHYPANTAFSARQKKSE